MAASVGFVDAVRKKYKYVREEADQDELVGGEKVRARAVARASVVLPLSHPSSVTCRWASCKRSISSPASSSRARA